MYKKYECSFFTATILEWKHLLVNDLYKQIVADSLSFLVNDNRINVHGFVIMSNHMHLLWHVKYPYRSSDVQRDFLGFTARKMLADMKKDQLLLEQYFAGAKDRRYQVWERNALSVGIWNETVLLQKLEYIHQNPVKAGLCLHASDYKYSSAGFYEHGSDDYDFLSHYLY